jgi:hypothetical protein
MSNVVYGTGKTSRDFFGDSAPVRAAGFDDDRPYGTGDHAARWGEHGDQRVPVRSSASGSSPASRCAETGASTCVGGRSTHRDWTDRHVLGAPAPVWARITATRTSLAGQARATQYVNELRGLVRDSGCAAGGNIGQ